MRPRRWRRGLTVLTVLLAACVAPIIPGAHADDGPLLSNFYLPLERGETDIVQGGHFSPGVDYTLTGASGIFTASGSSTATITADSNGRFQTPFTVGVEDVAPEVTTVTYEARAASSGDLVASVSVPLGPPESGRTVCPGQRFSTVFGGFPDGTYHLSSDIASFDPAVVQASDGQLSPTTVHVISNPLSAPMKLNVAPEGTDITWTSSWYLNDSRILTSRERVWDLRETFDCFAPGETVQVRGTHASVPHTVQTDKHGHVTVDVRAVAQAQPTTLHDAHLTEPSRGSRQSRAVSTSKGPACSPAKPSASIGRSCGPLTPATSSKSRPATS